MSTIQENKNRIDNWRFPASHDNNNDTGKHHPSIHSFIHLFIYGQQTNKQATTYLPYLYLHPKAEERIKNTLSPAHHNIPWSDGHSKTPLLSPLFPIINHEKFIKSRIYQCSPYPHPLITPSSPLHPPSPHHNTTSQQPPAS